MKELSLHILDIVHNSLAAGAGVIGVEILEDSNKDVLKFTITDNGCGMSPEMVSSVVDPFTTSRTTRKVGMGIPLLKLAAENTGGEISLVSKQGEGTEISATFGYSHIDRQPLGNMAETMLGLITSYEDVNFIYSHLVDGREFKFETSEIKAILGDVSLKSPEVMMWLGEFLNENEAELYK